MDSTANQHDASVTIALHFAAHRDGPDCAVGTDHFEVKLIGSASVTSALYCRGQLRGTARRVESQVLLVGRRWKHRIPPSEMRKLCRPGNRIATRVPPPIPQLCQPLRYGYLVGRAFSS